MIVDDDEHIKETIFDNEPINQYLLLNELDFKHDKIINSDEYMLGNEYFISSDQRFVVSRGFSLNLSDSTIIDHWAIYKNGDRLFTEITVKTIGEIKQYIKDNNYDNRQ